jgi:ribosomal protein S27AE
MPKPKETIVKSRSFRVQILDNNLPQIRYFNAEGFLVFVITVDLNKRELQIRTSENYDDLTITRLKETSQIRICDFNSSPADPNVVGRVHTNKKCPACGAFLLIDISTLNKGSYYCATCSYTKEI